MGLMKKVLTQRISFLKPEVLLRISRKEETSENLKKGNYQDEEYLLPGAKKDKLIFSIWLNEGMMTSVSSRKPKMIKLTN